MTEEIFVFCGWWFSNQLDIVSKTHFSCDTVDRELWLAMLSSLLCPEMDRNIRIGKQGYVFYFTDFKKWCFDVSFLTSISISTVVLTLGKLEFFKYINLRNILFIGFAKFEIKQWFSAYRCQLRLVEKYFCIIFYKKRLYISFSGFSKLFTASARLFCTLSFAQLRKILS